VPGDPKRSPAEEAESQGLAGVAVTIAGIAVAATIVAAIPDLRHAFSSAISGDTDAMRREVNDLGAWGVLVVLAMGLIHTVVWFPAEILDTVTGFVYGFLPGLAIVMATWMASAMVAYGIGAAAARPLLYRLAGRARFQRAEGMIHDGGITLLLMIRLIPIVPFSLFCIVCGAARVPLGRYAWTTLVGYLPITIVFVYLGSRLDSLSATDPRLILAAIALIAMLALTRWLGPRLRREP
jgi:uncharacterized membrane protein YdjX (TVP38/TMEM64 family)